MLARGTVAQLWRYPVKSMRGERCESLVVGPHGIDGDRRHAFESSNAPIGKPLLHSAERAGMLRSSAYLDQHGGVRVQVPAGSSLPIDDPRLPSQLGPEINQHDLALRSSPRPFTDVRPIALHSLASEQALSAELGSFDGRRLRSNITLDLCDPAPFAEDCLAQRRILLGSAVELLVLERIPRCRMISLDPETAGRDPAVLRWLARFREGRLGIYARTLVPGLIAVGDPVWQID